MIGCGAIGGAVVEALAALPAPRPELVAVLTRTPRPALPPGVSVTSLDALLAARPDVVMECAGQAALLEHAPAILGAGLDLIASSIGALADEGFADRLAAIGGPGRLVVASGAVAALDGLAAARLIGIETVLYRQIAPVTSWRGHPLAPPAIEQPGTQRVFAGTAREAARLFPKNANVTASVALAGIGFERTRVELVSDSAATTTRHEIAAEGAFGTLRLEISARPVAPGVRSSRLVAGSLLHAALRRDAAVVVA